MLREPKIVKILEPRLDILTNRDFVASIGGSNIVFKKEQANSKNTTDIQWNITTPNV